MNILETDHWCLLLPIEWRADYEEDVVRISDTDGVGEIEVSTLCKDNGKVLPAELAAMAREESPEVADWQEARFGAFSGVTGEFAEEATHVREWYLAAGKVMLYVTYVCDEENAGMDEAAVTEILGTLVAAG